MEFRISRTPVFFDFRFGGMSDGAQVFFSNATNTVLFTNVYVYAFRLTTHTVFFLSIFLLLV